MSLEYTILNPSELQADRARAILADVYDQIVSRKAPGTGELLALVDKAFRDFYLKLSDPAYEGYMIDKDDLVDPVAFNRELEKIQADLDSLYKDSGNLSNAIVSTFNINDALIGDTESYLKAVSSKSQNVQLATTIGSSLQFQAGDDFNSTEKLDDEKVTGPRCSIDTDQGVLSLNILESTNVNNKVNNISVTPIGTAGFYEGKFYGLSGETFPEGNQFILDKPLMRLGQLNYPRHAADQLRKEGRLAMVDGNQDTYWHAEICYRTIKPVTEGAASTALDENTTLYDFGEGLSVLELADSSQLTIIENVGDEAPDISRVDVLDDSLGTTPDAIFDKISANNEGGSAAELQFEFKEPVDINWLNLNPLNFWPGVYVTVQDITVATWDEPTVFTSIPGVKSGKHENTLTREANEELTQQEIAATLSPNKYQYLGQGIWTFPIQRRIKYLRVRLSQGTAIPAPYSVLRYEQSRTITATTTRTTEKSGVFGIGKSRKSRTETAVQNMKRVIELDYINTMRITSGAKSSNGLETSSGGDFDQSVVQEKPDTALAGAIGGAIAGALTFGIGTALGAALGGVLGGALGSLFGRTVHTTTDIDDTGYKTDAEYFVTKLDVAKYAIGVRDLGIFTYKYAADSSVVSKEFSVPGEISKVTLVADEFIPEGLEGVKDPIKYYVSLDGDKWDRILPTTQESLGNLDANVGLPSIINVNSDIPVHLQNPVEGYVTVPPENSKSVRVRIEMNGDPANPLVSPVLKGYRLNILTRGEF